MLDRTIICGPGGLLASSPRIMNVLLEHRFSFSPFNLGLTFCQNV